MQGDKKSKYNYATDKDTEMRLDDPLLDRHSTHPSTQASPRGIGGINPGGNTVTQSTGNIMALNMKMGLLGYEEVRGDRHILKKETVEQNLVTEAQYSFLQDMTLDLPGHFPTHMLLSISLLQTQSLSISLISLFLYYLPSLVVTLIFSQLDLYHNKYYSKPYSPDKNSYMFYLDAAIIGVSQAAVGLLFHNFVLLFKERKYDVFNVVLIIVSAFFTAKSNSFLMMVALMVLWGAFSMIKGGMDFSAEKPFDTTQKTIHLPYLGLPPFITFLTLGFFSLLVTEHSDKNSYVYLMASFYQIGSLTTAGGYSIIPLVLSQFGSELGFLEILKGFALVSLIPGPILNLAAFIGGVLNGIFTALICLLSVVIPGILILMSILPYPEKMRKNSGLRNFLLGFSLASIGFIFAAAFKLYSAVAFNNPYVGPIFSTFNIAACFLCLFYLNMKTPLVLLIGGFVVMMYSLF